MTAAEFRLAHSKLALPLSTIQEIHSRWLNPGTEIAWSIDGTRSIFDIFNLIRAEYGNVTTNSTEWKFAYVVTPDTPDIDLEAIAANIIAMEQAGLVELERR